MGAKGSCRIIIAVKKVESQGSCVGVFRNAVNCSITYVTTAKDSISKLVCGKDLENPDMERVTKADIQIFEVATMIKKSDGQDVIQNDKNNYKLVSTPELNLMITESKVDGIKQASGSADLIMADGVRIALTNVTCL
jgi:hypothetical protein